MSEHLYGPRASGCPTDPELASFVDGDLTSEARAGIVAHLAWCGACREVVATASLDAAARDPAPVAWHRRRGVCFAVAAGLVAALALMAMPRLTAPAPGSVWSELAQAAGEERGEDGRLSGIDHYRPMRGPSPGAEWDEPEAGPELEALAARLQATATEQPSPANLHAAAIAALMMGRADDAVRQLTRAAAPAGASAGLFADLAAAHAARAVRSPTPQAATADWLGAVEAAERACGAGPRLPAAWFNRAIALQGLGRRAAAQAWQDYLTRFPDEDGWRTEALARMSAGADE